MPISNDQATATVQRYLDLVATGTAEEITALFATDATIEDPVGADVLSGREAIHAFYASFASMTKTTELLTVRAAAGQAAFHFEIITETGDAQARMAPLEVMAFDDDGLISSMRAFWSDGDLSFE